jgi:uncharacterized protein with PIN domain
LEPKYHIIIKKTYLITYNYYIICWWGKIIRKKCPECQGKAVRLYQNKSIKGKRKWIPVAWYCTKCSYIYQVISNTLIYKIGDKNQNINNNEKCPKCNLKLVRIYRHINPINGKQQWISKGNYCTRCKYVWIDQEEEI